MDFPAALRLSLLIVFGVVLFSASRQLQARDCNAQQDQEPPNPPAEMPETQATEQPVDPLTQVQSILDSVQSPNIQALLQALEAEAGQVSRGEGDESVSALINLGDLDGDGVPEGALKWLMQDVPIDAGAAPTPDNNVEVPWGLFLVSWDGAHWKASQLALGFETTAVLPLSLGKSGPRGVAVVTVTGEDATPYPAIYTLEDHAAKLLWDGSADDSKYHAFSQGKIEFHDGREGRAAEMVAHGRADPGLLTFQKNGQRGFQATELYRWDGQSFIPVETHYEANPDYSLYQFISALHLHNFRAAYALIDPAKFLNTDTPTLDMFREFMESSWPEFLDDQVFEAIEVAPGSSNPYGFMVPEKTTVYRPKFAGGGKLLLTGLERVDQSSPAEPASPQS